jgi:hypothetical protein
MMGIFFEMMITDHRHEKHKKFVVLERFKNSKYHFRNFKLQESFTRCKWVIMCMTYEQSFGL